MRGAFRQLQLIDRHIELPFRTLSVILHPSASVTLTQPLQIDPSPLGARLAAEGRGSPVPTGGCGSETFDPVSIGLQTFCHWRPEFEILRAGYGNDRSDPPPAPNGFRLVFLGCLPVNPNGGHSSCSLPVLLEGFHSRGPDLTSLPGVSLRALIKQEAGWTPPQPGGPRRTGKHPGPRKVKVASARSNEGRPSAMVSTRRHPRPRPEALVSELNSSNDLVYGGAAAAGGGGLASRPARLIGADTQGAL
ncbi:unnamed protein product [Gadus morhua 'NCC']